MKKRGIKVCLFMAAAVLLTQLFYGNVSVKADVTVVDNYVSLSKTVTNTKGQNGTDISAAGGEGLAINYTINSKSIPQDSINATQVLSSFKVTSVEFTEQFPSDVTIIKAPADFVIDNDKHTVTGELTDLIYTLDNNTYKLSSPLSFEIDIRFKDRASGEYSLSSSSNLTYTDYNKHVGNKAFNIVKVKVTSSEDKVSSAPIEFTSSIEKNEYPLINGTTEDIRIKHSIVPKNIDFCSVQPEDYFKNRYVVIVADTSESMNENINEKSRLETLKDTLISSGGFIDSFKGESNVNVALVSYGDIAKLGDENNPDASDDIKDEKGVSIDFANMDSTTQVGQLKKQVQNLKASGGNNVGDGIRRAYWLLSKVESNAKKYIVLMTDGFPTAFSYADGTLKYSSSPDKEHKSIAGKVYADNHQDNFYDIFGTDFNFDDGLAVNYAVNAGDSDLENYAIKYSEEMGKKVAADKDISSYIIGFSSGKNSNRLTDIAESADASYKEAESASDLKDVYKDIAGNIIDDLQVSNGKFTTVIPAGLKLKNIEAEGIKLSKDKYSITENSSGDCTLTFNLDDIGGIHYKLDKDKKIFQADSVNFDIIVNGTQADKYILNKENTYITYKDIDMQNAKLCSNKALEFVVYESRVREHGLYTNSDNTIADSNFVFSTGDQPLDIVKGSSCTAGVVADITGINTPLIINIGSENKNGKESEVAVEVIKVGEDGKTYNDNDKIANSATTQINPNGGVAIKVKFDSVGTYLVTYTFKMNVNNGGTLTNTAAIGNSNQRLILSVVKDLPDLF